MDQKHNPLKAKPLRQAGQSVQEELDKVIDEHFISYGLVIVFIFAYTVSEWIRWYFHIPPKPVHVTILSLLIISYCLIKLLGIKKQIKALKLGRDGEKVVGEFLERLRQDGCIIYHDIVGDNFNLDHVVLSTKGIYVIETKTYSKPKNKQAKVHYDGTHLIIDSIGNKDEILVQVEAESSWLKEILSESTGKVFNIKPIAVFPGWFVESTNHNKFWVLNPKGLPKFIQNQKESISKEDLQLTAYHLSRYIRTLAA